MTETVISGVPKQDVLQIVKTVFIDIPALAIASGGSTDFHEVTLNTGLTGAGGYAFMAFHSFTNSDSYNQMPITQPIIDTDSTTQSGGIQYTYQIFGDIVDGEFVLNVQATNYSTVVGQTTARIRVYIFRAIAQ